MEGLQHFLEDDTTLLVLRVLVLLAALLWLLTGFRFLDRGKKKPAERRGRKPGRRDR